MTFFCKNPIGTVKGATHIRYRSSGVETRIYILQNSTSTVQHSMDHHASWAMPSENGDKDYL